MPSDIDPVDSTLPVKANLEAARDAYRKIIGDRLGETATPFSRSAARLSTPESIPDSLQRKLFGDVNQGTSLWERFQQEFPEVQEANLRAGALTNAIGLGIPSAISNRLLGTQLPHERPEAAGAVGPEDRLFLDMAPYVVFGGAGAAAKGLGLTPTALKTIGPMARFMGIGFTKETMEAVSRGESTSEAVMKGGSAAMVNAGLYHALTVSIGALGVGAKWTGKKLASRREAAGAAKEAARVAKARRYLRDFAESLGLPKDRINRMGDDELSSLIGTKLDILRRKPKFALPAPLGARGGGPRAGMAKLPSIKEMKKALVEIEKSAKFLDASPEGTRLRTLAAGLQSQISAGAEVTTPVEEVTRAGTTPLIVQPPSTPTGPPSQPPLPPGAPPPHPEGNIPPVPLPVPFEAPKPRIPGQRFVADIADAAATAALPANVQMKRFGEAGKRAARIVEDHDVTYQRYVGEAEKEWFELKKKLSKKQRQAAIAQRDPLFKVKGTEKLRGDKEVIAAGKKVQRITDNWFYRAKALGVKVRMPDGRLEPISQHYHQGYFMHMLQDVYKEALLAGNPAVREAAVRHLIDTGQAKNAEDALGLIGESVKSTPKQVAYGPLEHPRIAKFPASFYELDVDKVMSRMIRGNATYLSAIKHFGKKLDRVKSLVGRIEVESGRDAATYTKTVMERLAYGDTSTAGSRVVGTIAGVFANTMLSLPTSGLKNYLMGTTQSVMNFGVRRVLGAHLNFLTHPSDTYLKIIESGAVEAGVHLLGGAKILKLSPGLMYPTEIANRVTSAVAAEATARDALDVLMGRKRPGYTPGVAENERWARHVLEDMFGLDIDSLVRRGYLTKRDMQRVHVKGSSATQGRPTPAFMPPWLSAPLMRPLSLFQRMAYRTTENVIKEGLGEASKGNVGPLLRYVLGVGASGSALYLASYLAYKREPEWQTLPWYRQILAVQLRGELLGFFSNFFQYGGLMEGYAPVVIRSLDEARQHIAWALTGAASPVDSVDSIMRQNIAIYRGIRQRWDAEANPQKHEHNTVRRFVNTYARSRNWKEPFTSVTLQRRTKRSPYLSDLRKVFWVDDTSEHIAAWNAAYTALRNPSNTEGVPLDHAEARGTLKRVITAMRPINLSESRKKIYANTLSPSMAQRHIAAEDAFEKRKAVFLKTVEANNPPPMTRPRISKRPSRSSTLRSARDRRQEKSWLQRQKEKK